MSLSEREWHILEHSLTGSLPEKEWHRNFYATAPDCEGYDIVQGLVKMGLMVAGIQDPFRSGAQKVCYYHVTNEGKKLLKERG